MDRKSQLVEFARRLGKLENEFQVKIISSNGFTDAVVVDQSERHGYDYKDGRITHSDDCCIEDLD
ncbi:hypothetical protein [Robertmurraya siralis]|uniref:hypothetical protein n=1 Tax=Robertmurraya siralis TaxID=77777 RepID=UPI0010F5B5A7|nr:hypothetical protein [Robertmurraya siralis]